MLLQDNQNSLGCLYRQTQDAQSAGLSVDDEEGRKKLFLSHCRLSAFVSQSEVLCLKGGRSEGIYFRVFGKWTRPAELLELMGTAGFHGKMRCCSALCEKCFHML